MKSIAKWATSIILQLVAILMYVNSNAFISNQSWKYRDGAHIGDWLEFRSSNLKLEGRSIIDDGQVIAKMKICLGKILIIENIKTGINGYYINK